MLISPTRTRDGRSVDAASNDPDALLVSIDRPTKPDVAAFSGEVARFEGWAMSLDPEPRMRVLVDGMVEREFKLASPRQDVVDFLGPGDPRDARGFEFELPLEPRAGAPRTVIIEVEDDRYVAVSPTFRIHHSPSLALHDDYVDTTPTARNAVDLFAGEWVSELPGDLASATGGLGLFDDDRITDALAILGGVENARVLELGPLEGGHTFMLEQAGAAEVLGIEANGRCYLKCLVTKEVCGLTRSRFLRGDFMAYLSETPDRFDLVLASGVLYHQREPLELLQLLARVTDRVVLWTVYYDAAQLGEHLQHHFPGKAVERKLAGRRIALHAYEYGTEWEGAKFCGGSTPGSRWMEREDILASLHLLGFEHQVIPAKYDECHFNGPGFPVVAWK